MKIEVQKGIFVQALQTLQNVTERKSTMPILANVMISAMPEQTLELSVTDLELCCRTHVDAQIAQPGKTSVSARKLYEIIKELPDMVVSAEMLPSRKFAIESGRARFELATIPADDFPRITFYEDAQMVPFDGPTLRACLNKTMYGIPMEEDPFNVGGLYWHALGSGDVRFVALDGHRLCYMQLTGSGMLESLGVSEGVIIPRKGVQELLRLVEREDEVHLGIHENTLLVRAGANQMGIRLLQSKFPEYSQIIPEERPCSLSIDRVEFLHALKRMAILSNPPKWRHVSFVIENGTLGLESGDPELGNATESLDIDYQGESFNISFNIKYILDAVQVMESAQVRFEWVDIYHGGIFIGVEDPGYLGFVMPMVM